MRPMDRTSRSARTRAFALLTSLSLLAAPVAAQRSTPSVTNGNADKLVQLDFDDVELAAVIETIARLTNKNFIFDDRVRGRVTIISPSQVTVEQAYAVFESVLQVKGFTTVPGPGGVIKVIPVREAKESSIETVTDAAPSPNRDHFVTRLIPLDYISAQDITNTLKPLVSKDAAMVAYPPTNTIILTDSASNIRRLLKILEAIDVSSYREELAVIRIEHADAAVLGEQLSTIYGAEVSSTGISASPRRTTRRATSPRTPDAASQLAPGIRVRIITDSRTNSLLVLAPAAQIRDVRELVAKLDVPIEGSGRIHVHYLKHADAEEMAQTLNAVVSGQSGPSTPGTTGAVGAPGGGVQLRSAVTALAEGITLTADPGTNSLVIQASKEAYETLRRVIDKLDIQRPQVLVEALIMEVDVTNGMALGFNALVRFLGEGDITIGSATDAATRGALTGAAGPLGSQPFAVNAVGSPGDTTIQAILRASATDNSIDVISAPHILTSDNEEAEIRIGNNIPIVTSRLEGATGNPDGLSTSVNVERQDIGVTLRVTPQISEGDTLRLKIFQELSDVNEALTDAEFGSDEGVALTNTRIENTLVVNDGATIAIGGLISESVQDVESKVPFLGDIPILGWAFKTVATETTKQNLLVFLTPHIIRSAEDLERATIDRREKFGDAAGGELSLHGEDRALARDAGITLAKLRAHDPVEGELSKHRERYPVERLDEIERQRFEQPESIEEIEQIQQIQRIEAAPAPEARFGLRAGVYAREEVAMQTLADILDAGHDGALVTTEDSGTLLYEVQVGPFNTVEDAQTASALLRGSLGLEPSVTVIEGAAD